VTTGSAGAQTAPFHRFHFDVEAGYYLEDSAVVGERVLGGRSIYGEALLVRCEITEEFGSGLRVAINSPNENETYNIGFRCDPESGLISFTFRHARAGSTDEDWVTLEEFKGEIVGRRGERLTFTLSTDGSHLSASFGEYKLERDLNFQPGELHFYAFGSTGVANFYDLGEFVS